MTDLILSLKNSILESTSPFSINRKTDYSEHVPESAEEFMKNNWDNVGRNLFNAIVKVGEEIERQQEAKK